MEKYDPGYGDAVAPCLKKNSEILREFYGEKGLHPHWMAPAVRDLLT